MTKLRNYLFICDALGIELHSKYRIRKYYFDKKEYMSDHDLNLLMNKKAFGKFTYQGDEWSFKSIFIEKIANHKASKDTPHQTHLPKPYTKVIGNFLITYSGTTHRPINTKMHSPSKTTI
jgi:hypothetical protein